MKITELFAQNNLHIQEETYTCGPCSLLNILRLKGDATRTELELAALCKARKGIGASHEDMVKAAQAVELQIITEKRDATMADIEHDIDAGSYIIVNFIDMYSGNGHYSLITEYDDRAFYLRDCTAGLFRLEKNFLKKCWRSGDGIPCWYMAVK
ncbi:MAG TPA: C39 family peptidase [Patescibacteria group bacterium]|nr:C39 family peptidase [Patescibacteria group bacterium]